VLAPDLEFARVPWRRARVRASRDGTSDEDDRTKTVRAMTNPAMRRDVRDVAAAPTGAAATVRPAVR